MKRSIIYLILLFTVLAVIFSTYYAKDSYKLIPVNTHLNEKPEPLSESWFEYDSPGGAFNVSFPLLPQTATQNLADPKTNESRQYEMYVAQTDNGIIYMISLITFVRDLDETEKPLILKQVMQDMVAANPENKLKNEKDVTYQGKPAVDFTIENDKNVIQAKEFFKNNTIYLLSVISKPNDVKDTHFDYFIKSFKLKNPENKP